jgi:hypothetical protein
MTNGLAEVLDDLEKSRYRLAGVAAAGLLFGSMRPPFCKQHATSSAQK